MKTKRISLLVIMSFFTIIFLSNCGARKSQVSKKEVEIKKDVAVSIKKNVTKTVEVENFSNEFIETITYTPVDTEKPSAVDDVEFINTSIKKEKRTLKVDKKTKEKTVDKTIKAEEDKSESKEVSKEKTVDKKQFNYLNLLWILIPIGLAWYYRKKIFKFLPIP